MERAVAILVFTAFFIFPSTVLAKEYIVGDDEGWNSDVDYNAWLHGKTFDVGDELVFNYDKDDHNMIVVNATGYNQCVASPNLGANDSGKDKITLRTPGNKYYICEWQCGYSAQKIKVHVLPRKI